MNTRTAVRRHSVRRGISTFLVCAMACAAPPLVQTRVCWAQASARAQTDLEAAEQAMVNLDYENANKLASGVVKQRGLSHEQLVRAYRVLAITNAVLDREDAAREAFRALLTFDPDFQADPNLGPKVQAPFMEARGFLRAQPVRPGIEAAVSLRPSEEGAIRVTTRDPLHIAKKVNVGWRWGGEGSFTTAQVPPGEGQVVRVAPPPSGTTRLDYYAQALDDRDGAVFEVGNATSPKTATLDVSTAGGGGAVAGNGAEQPHESHSVFASPVFWIIAGVVVAGAATGAYFATRKTEELPPTSATLTPSLSCGSIKCN